MEKKKTFEDKIDLKVVVIGGAGAFIIFELLDIILTSILDKTVDFTSGTQQSTITTVIMVLYVYQLIITPIICCGLVGFYSKKKPWLDGALAAGLFYLLMTLGTYVTKSVFIPFDFTLEIIIAAAVGAVIGFIGGKIANKIQTKKNE